jgi:hypothetical protein
MNKKISNFLLLIVFIFFTNVIKAATIITSNTSIDQAWINSNSSNLPIELNANVTITILENLSFNDVNMYFAIRGTDVTIDGNGKTITINNVTDYMGFVNNGNYLGNNASAFSGSVVKSIGIISIGSTLNSSCGWIGQQGYGNGEGFSIINCYSTGDLINSSSGGILGQAYMNGTISNCYSLGNIIGDFTAGIVASPNFINNRIINCYANGIKTGTNANFICEQIDWYQYNMSMLGFTQCYSSNGTFNTENANSNLTGTDGSIWNTTVIPYTLSVFVVLKWGITSNGQKTQVNSIQLDKNGKKGSIDVINQNGKIN